ncbi:sulfite exporter TauE/SafE family protein [Limimaricola litoreus]|uniref:Probable membrane transporter protein n=1 Tax=Limimaricola litoreus TaxID=2955316 RepID=A0A9X2JQH6_9RHOB|nr:sulfite exporter TauE/SafE family protein [Limimaricola litoreus]MCP1167626.1 sulfite exporter TauE/SafE family protein [Limimaricola litoreus]
MQDFVFSDPWALLAGCVAVVLVGLSKGGLGGALALLGVPIMALAIPPVQAAGILLPILLVMDAISLWAWRGQYHAATLKRMLPGAAIGIGIGWLTAALVSDAMVRLIVGVVALAFSARWLLSGQTRRAAPRPQNAARASVWATLAGYTSFVAHAGGPPFQVYAMPLRLDPKLYTGTSVIFFAVVNVIKVIPYAALGQFDATNLFAAAALLPLAVVATLSGAFVVRRMRAEVFYPVMYVMVVLVGLRLCWDGLSALF